MSMLIPVSYSWRTFYPAVLRIISLWLEQVRLSQTSATLAPPDDLRRSFHTVIEPHAPASGRAQDHWMNRAFLMRFAVFITTVNLKYIYETRHSAAPPSAGRLATPSSGRLQSRTQGSRKTNHLAEDRFDLHWFQKIDQRLLAIAIPQQSPGVQRQEQQKRS